MLKKIIITSLIIAAAIIFYNKFVKDTANSFFEKKVGKVDLFQIKSTIDGMDID